MRTYLVVRVADDILVDLMLSACGIRYPEAAPQVERRIINDVSVPFALPELLLRMKQTHREKDALDRLFLEEKIRQRG